MTSGLIGPITFGQITYLSAIGLRDAIKAELGLTDAMIAAFEADRDHALNRIAQAQQAGKSSAEAEAELNFTAGRLRRWRQVRADLTSCVRQIEQAMPS